MKLFNNNTYDLCQVLTIRSKALTTFTNNNFMDIRNLIISDTQLSIFKNNTLNGVQSLILSENKFIDDSIADELIAMNMEKLLFLDLSK